MSVISLIGHNFSFFNPNISKKSVYMISQKLPSSMTIQDTSKWAIIVIMTQIKISFEIMDTSKLTMVA